MDGKRDPVAVQLRHIMLDSLIDEVIAIVVDYCQFVFRKAAFQFGEIGTEDGKLKYPSAMVGDDTHIYVCDTDNHRIQIWDYLGTWISAFGSEGSDKLHFKSPAGIIVHNNFLFISDEFNKRIQVTTKQGNYVSQFDVGFRCGALGQKDDEIYVCNLDDDCLAVFSDEGKFRRSWGHDGLFKTTFSGARFNLLLDEDRIYVAGNGVVIIFDLQGSSVETWGNSMKVRFRRPYAISAYGGEVCVGDETSVKVFDKTGELSQIIGTKGSELGEFDYIRGLIHWPSALYVLDCRNCRVQAFYAEQLA